MTTIFDNLIKLIKLKGDTQDENMSFLVLTWSRIWKQFFTSRFFLETVFHKLCLCKVLSYVALCPYPPTLSNRSISWIPAQSSKVFMFVWWNLETLFVRASITYGFTSSLIRQLRSQYRTCINEHACRVVTETYSTSICEICVWKSMPPVRYQFNWNWKLELTYFSE